MRSRPMRYARLPRWVGPATAVLLLSGIAMPTLAAAQDAQLQLVSTPWSPFTNVPGQPRFALDLVGAALKRMDVHAETAIVGEARLTPSLHFAVRRSHPAAESIITQFNAELQGMIADGSYHRLLHLDWVQADVDGDGRPEYVPHADQAGPHPPQHS